ncbi:aminotransferase class I/II-fold pyridoxal phosphate-dependent enzyme [Marinitoga aeolica]
MYMKFVDKIPISKTIEINTLAKKLIEDGKDVINLTAGEPDFPTPNIIKEKAKEALEKNFTNYTDSKGIPELRESISRMLYKKDIHFLPNEILVTNGGKQALFNTFLSILDREDEVILFSPFWVSYVPGILLTGAKPVILKTEFENNFLPDINKLRKLVTSKTKAILVNSPNNPTGVIYPEEIVIEISRIANENKIFVITDEVYDFLVYEDNFSSFAKYVDKNQLIYINSFSKSYSMTGWRIGFVALKNQLIYNRIVKIQGHSITSVNSIAQYASTVIDEVDNSYMLKEFKKRRDFVISKSREIGLTFVNPKGAFYLFFKSPIEDDSLFCKTILEEKLIALIPGSAFNEKGFVRLSFTNSIEKLEEGFRRIKEFV